MKCTRFRVKKKTKFVTVWKWAVVHAASPAPPNTDTGGGSGGSAGGSSITWSWTGSTWQHSNGTLPECPATPFTLPTDGSLTGVTTILYPGQTRGGNYKPHGGFGYATSTAPDSVSVVAPFAGSIVRGVRYYDTSSVVYDGQVQFMIDIINPCGLMIRFDHLRALTPTLAGVVSQLPSPTSSSATTQITPVAVTQGQQVGTGVGFTDTANNVFFDFGYYDLRSVNGTSHSGELAGYARCWFDDFGSSNDLAIRALPSRDGVAGTTSDLC